MKDGDDFFALKKTPAKTVFGLIIKAKAKPKPKPKPKSAKRSITPFAFVAGKMRPRCRVYRMEKFFDLQTPGDGRLTVVEGGRDLPFAIARVYYFSGLAADERRGFHAHKALQQAAVCARGSCKFLLDDGKSRREVVLDSPARALYIGPMIWREFYDFSPDCLLRFSPTRLTTKPITFATTPLSAKPSAN